MEIDPQTLTPGEKYRLLITTVVPRPIAFISTVGEHGVPNAAPFSFYMGVAADPPLVAIAVGHRSGEMKDTARNIEVTRDFVVNVVDETIAEQMVMASGDFPREVSEFGPAGLTPVASRHVRSPRISEAPVSLECRVVQLIPLAGVSLIVGEVVCFHVRDDLLVNGAVDISRLRPVGRLGGTLYCRVREVFEMLRPRVTK